MRTITFATAAQAEFANTLHRAARDLARTLQAVETQASRDQELLAAGYQPIGLGHQVLSEVVAHQAKFEALSALALTQGLTLEQVNLLVTEKDVWATEKA